MSLDQIHGFVAVAEEGHFGRAARRLATSQPALSRQIQRLESELGVVLFERTSRAVRLAPAGAAFLAHARTIVAGVERARRAALDALAPSPADRCDPLAPETCHVGGCAQSP